MRVRGTVPGSRGSVAYDSILSAEPLGRRAGCRSERSDPLSRTERAVAEHPSIPAEPIRRRSWRGPRRPNPISRVVRAVAQRSSFPACLRGWLPARLIRRGECVTAEPHHCPMCPPTVRRSTRAMYPWFCRHCQPGKRRLSRRSLAGLYETERAALPGKAGN